MVETLLTTANAPLLLQGIGAIGSAFSAKYQAQNQIYQLKSKALSMQFEQGVAEINRDLAEFQAEQVLLNAEKQKMFVGLKAGKAKGTTRASLAARGIALETGSPLEIMETMDLMQDMDMFTISANATQQAFNIKTQALGFGTQAASAALSSSNLLTTAGGISPFGEVTTSLLGSATNIASSWYQNQSAQRLNAILSQRA